MVSRAPKEPVPGREPEIRTEEREKRRERTEVLGRAGKTLMPETLDLTSVLDTIETPLMRVILTSKGASIKSIQLKKYKDQEKRDVELIPEGQKAFTDMLIMNGTSVDLKDNVFQILKRDKNYIVYGLNIEKRLLKKEYTFNDTSYMADLSLKVEDVEKYKILVNSGLNATERDVAEELRYFAGVASTGENPEPLFKNVNSLDTTEFISPGNINWVGIKNKYFLAAIIPQKIETIEYSIKRFGKERIGGGAGCMCAMAPPTPKDPSSMRIGISLTTRARDEFCFKIYTGPLDYDKMKKMGTGLENACYFGFKWIRPISRFVLKIFLGLHKFIPNFGLVIIVFSLLMTVVFYPFTKTQHKSMMDMQRIQPKIQALRQKYKKDPQRLNKETMEIYKKHKVNPVGGCLPMIFQMPVFFALYAILQTTIAMRGATFVPHWIDDLSYRDPYYILPLLMGGMMFLQTKLQGTANTQNQQQKMMMYFMPIFMTVIFLRFPAGIVLYWCVYNMFSNIQSYLIRKKYAQIGS